jgi:hypothetical protein
MDTFTVPVRSAPWRTDVESTPLWNTRMRSSRATMRSRLSA